ncbi:glycosyltransferase family 31 protein, partial [Lophiostoma macrostomum CBS 122681]
CAHFSSAKNVFVVIKTGATEIHKKLPIHFKTTLRCIPHFAIYSDMNETINNYKVHDILESISPETKTESDDFTLYHRLHDSKVQSSEKLGGSWNEDDKKKAWALDKWKFLPIMAEAYETRPEAAWFVFLETDTAILWSNLFLWLQQLDARKHEPLYLGGQTWAGDVMFAHGGSGWIMTNSAVQRVADKWRKEQEALEKMTMSEWAGDKLLSMVLKSVGVDLTQSWPIIQGETPFTLDYTVRHWCMPVVTYHHVDEEWVKNIADFEESVLKQTGVAIRHRDAFEWFVQPNLAAEKQDWDSISQDEKKDHFNNTDECRRACENKPSCLQWSFELGKCKTGTVIRLGSVNNQGVVSGWMMDRIAAFKNAQPDPCPENNWIV